VIGVVVPKYVYNKHPVAFFMKTLRDVELRYDIIEKQAYALIKSLKDFRI